MQTLILPYRVGSKSARTLARELGLRRVNLNREVANNRPCVLINWGNCGSNLPPEGVSNAVRVFNPVDRVSVASNKLKAFTALSEAGVTIPEFTTDIQVAQSWAEDGKEVVERHKVSASGGRGIRIASHPDDVQSAPLYTQYVKKIDEYRVHVIDGVVVDVQRKAKRRDAEAVDWRIRNYDRGFVFVRQDLDTPMDVIGQALSTIDALGLDFGAVDVIWNQRRERAYVLEVNTAPGLEGTTVSTYVRGITSLLNGDTPEAFNVNSQENTDVAED